MTDQVEHIARSAAARLVERYGPGVPLAVEDALSARNHASQSPQQYGDWIGVGEFIVTVATLAWTIYDSQSRKRQQTHPDALARAIRVQLHDTGEVTQDRRDWIIDVVVAETISITIQHGNASTQ